MALGVNGKPFTQLENLTRNTLEGFENTTSDIISSKNYTTNLPSSALSNPVETVNPLVELVVNAANVENETMADIGNLSQHLEMAAPASEFM